MQALRTALLSSTTIIGLFASLRVFETDVNIRSQIKRA